MYQVGGRRLLACMKIIVTLAVLAVLAGGCATTSEGDSPSAATTSSAKATPSKTAAPKPSMTKAQENAVESANSYLDLSGFSKAGLVTQLVQGEQFKKADAQYAVNHVKADWNKEAVEAAKAYLDMSSFSRAGLIQQLTQGDGFTKAQAEYAANKVGL